MTMSIFEKFKPLAATRHELEENCDTFFNIVMKEIISGTEAVVNGRPTILAGSNNYLGLSFDSDCIDAACNAVRREGTGTTGSRMANGTFAGHLALERELAEYFDRQSAIVFSTGYIANLAMLSTLVGPSEVIPDRCGLPCQHLRWMPPWRRRGHPFPAQRCGRPGKALTTIRETEYKRAGCRGRYLQHAGRSRALWRILSP